ncbi:hypothetical protein FNF31_02104 [Cafeteria roenbergensis]|nr:hypothetical protein FNF31_02104 [Cafeteria roenbergensis]
MLVAVVDAERTKTAAQSEALTVSSTASRPPSQLRTRLVEASRAVVLAPETAELIGRVTARVAAPAGNGQGACTWQDLATAWRDEAASVLGPSGLDPSRVDVASSALALLVSAPAHEAGVAQLVPSGWQGVEEAAFDMSAVALSQQARHAWDVAGEAMAAITSPLIPSLAALGAALVARRDSWVTAVAEACAASCTEPTDSEAGAASVLVAIGAAASLCALHSSSDSTSDVGQAGAASSPPAMLVHVASLFAACAPERRSQWPAAVWRSTA